MHMTHASFHLTTVALTMIVAPLCTLCVTSEYCTGDVCVDSSLLS